MTRKQTKPERMEAGARREQIVAAALKTFSRLRYRGATKPELARGAGISEVTLFRHFPSKEDLFGAVLDTYSILPVLKSELEHPEPDKDVHATLRRLGRQFLGIMKARKDVIRLMLAEAATNPRQAQMLFRQGPGRFLEGAEKMLSGLRRKGAIRPVDVPLAARALLGVHLAYMLMNEVFGKAGGGEASLDKAADEISTLLWQGLRPEISSSKGGRRR
jgi:AcrR family transcriptional regulator